VGRRVDRERRLATQFQRPAVEPRRCAPGSQRAGERLRPQVLMEVDTHV
jgi:hypothetical protein